MESPLVIYHNPCPDGFTAVWLIRNWLESLDMEPEYIPTSYHNDAPDATDRDVIMVDFCWDSTDTMRTLFDQARSLLLLDHHKTSAEMFGAPASVVPQFLKSVLPLVTDPKKRVTFSVDSNVTAFRTLNLRGKFLGANEYVVLIDQRYSGAGLASMYTDQDYPFVPHVQARDLWDWSDPNTDPVTAAVTSYEFTFENWDRLSRQSVKELVEEGQPIVRYRNQLIRYQCDIAQKITVNGIEMLGTPAPYAIGSDVAGELAKRSKSSIGAYWVDHPGGIRKIGLRSTEDGPDVADIAKLFGGGGHVHASGFGTAYEIEIPVPEVKDGAD